MIIYYIRSNGSIIEDHSQYAHMGVALSEVRSHDPRLSGTWLRVRHPEKVVFVEVNTAVLLSVGEVERR